MHAWKGQFLTSMLKRKRLQNLDIVGLNRQKCSVYFSVSLNISSMSEAKYKDLPNWAELKTDYGR